jgi:ferric-dicitrate binding protein FerR (iron transport regulator)
MNIDERELRRWSDNVAKQMNILEREVIGLKQFQSDVQYDKQVQAALEITSRMQSGHAAYTNLVIAAGYAAYFTLWSTLKSDLPNRLYSLSGLMITLSLLIFMSWEITKMIWSAVAFHNIEKRLASRSASPEAVTKWQQEILSFDRQVSRVWIWFLVPTILFGLSSSLCLIGFFAWRLWGAFNG